MSSVHHIRGYMMVTGFIIQGLLFLMTLVEKRALKFVCAVTLSGFHRCKPGTGTQLHPGYAASDHCPRMDTGQSWWFCGFLLA